MKNIFKKFFKKKQVKLFSSPEPGTLEYYTMNALNYAIQSPLVQDMTFKVSSDCVDSVLNDIEFCDLLGVSDTYDVAKVIDDACVSLCKSTKDVAYDACDATRKTCKSGCDVIEASYEACKIACCYGCIWGKTCSCDSVKKEYDNCNNDCDNMSSDCKSGADSMYNSCVNGCGYITLKGGYDLKVNDIKGLGAIKVTNVYNMSAHADNENIFDITVDVIVDKTYVDVFYKVWQDPIPAVQGTLPIVVYNIKGTGTGKLYRVCEGNEEGKEPGYYVELDQLKIELPSHIYDGPWIDYLQALGIDTSHLQSGVDALWGLFKGMADGKLSSLLLKELNKVLEDLKLMDSGC